MYSQPIYLIASLSFDSCCLLLFTPTEYIRLERALCVQVERTKANNTEEEGHIILYGLPS